MQICVIPARGGSTRIPRKNIRDFHGKPIIAYSVDAAIASRLFDHGGVFVSTEDEEIGKIARRYGATWWKRNPDLASNDIGTQEVAREVIAQWCHSSELACCIYPTAPLMTVADLKLGHDDLIRSTEPYVYSAGYDGQDAGQWYWGRAAAFIDRLPLEGNSQLFYLPDARVCDINTEADWKRAEKLYAKAMIHGS